MSQKIADLNKKMQKTQKEKEKILSELRTFLRDRANPLEERWELFLDSIAIGTLDGTTTNARCHLDVAFGKKYSLYDDFFLERYETIDFSRMYDRMLELCDDPKHPEYSHKNIHIWQEAVLQDGNKNFKYDW